LDGQILAYPEDMRTGRGWIVCSGPADLHAEHETTLKAAAGNVFHAGDKNGAAPAFDKAHNSFGREARPDDAGADGRTGGARRAGGA
jgi:3-hydroxyisobutyrate dehydrogenase-like beta-hydroxyacid dehydrogenase